jgi:hypothetical protein
MLDPSQQTEALPRKARGYRHFAFMFALAVATLGAMWMFR